MKKNKMLFTGLLLLLFATYSCEKEEIQPEATPISSEILKKVNPVFLEHDLSAYQIKPIWDSFITFDNADAVEVNFSIDKKFYVPLSKNGKIRGRQRLLLTFEKGKVIETILEYIPSDGFMGNIKDINSGNFKSKQFDGEITFKHPNDNYSIVWVLSKGVVIKKLKRTELISKQKKTHKTAELIEVCSYREIEYEICAGSGEAESCVTHTKDVYDCVWIDYTDPETPPEVDPYDCAVNDSWPWCQDDGGGGSNPTDPTDPPVEEECSAEKFETFANSINAISQFVSSGVIDETDETIEKFYTWVCIEGTYYKIISTEIGVVRKTNNPNSPKEWISLEHSSLTPEGTILCGSVSITSEASISTVGTYTAHMALSVGLNVTSEVLGSPVNKYLYYNPSKTFSVND